MELMRKSNQIVRFAVGSCFTSFPATENGMALHEEAPGENRSRGTYIPPGRDESLPQDSPWYFADQNCVASSFVRFRSRSRATLARNRHCQRGQQMRVTGNSLCDMPSLGQTSMINLAGSSGTGSEERLSVRRTRCKKKSDFSSLFIWVQLEPWFPFTEACNRRPTRRPRLRWSNWSGDPGQRRDAALSRRRPRRRRRGGQRRHHRSRRSRLCPHRDFDGPCGSSAGAKLHFHADLRQHLLNRHGLRPLPRSGAAGHRRTARAPPSTTASPLSAPRTWAPRWRPRRSTSTAPGKPITRSSSPRRAARCSSPAPRAINLWPCGCPTTPSHRTSPRRW